MSEAAIFGIGAVMFVLTTGATVTFGLHRSHELHIKDMEKSKRIAEIEESQYTEIYRTQPVSDDPETS